MNIEWGDARLLSCLDLCSERLKARLQKVHLYFFSGAVFEVGDTAEAVVAVAVPAAMMKSDDQISSLLRVRSGPELSPVGRVWARSNFWIMPRVMVELERSSGLLGADR